MKSRDPHDPGSSNGQELVTASASLLRGRFRGALLGLTVGDSLGAPFEGHTTVSQFEWESVADAEGELSFTDDTHMTFGVAESLLARPQFDAAHMAAVFARDYFDEPWRGYGAGPPKVFSSIMKGVPAEVAARSLYGGSGSLGNGAAMRVTPIGLVFAGDLVRTEQAARRSAAITHVLPAAPPRPGLHTDEASALDRAEALLLKLEDAPGQSSSRMNQMRPSNLATRHHSGKVSDGL